MSITTHRSTARRPRHLIPTSQQDDPTVESLRARAVLSRIRSEALASVIAGHAYAVAERRI